MISETENAPADNVNGTDTANDDSTTNESNNLPALDTSTSTEDSEVYGQASEAMMALINNQPVSDKAIDRIAQAESKITEQTDLIEAIRIGGMFWKCNAVLRTDLYLGRWRKSITAYYDKHAADNFDSLSYVDLQVYFRDLATAIEIVQQHVFDIGLERHKTELLYGRPVQNGPSFYQIDSVDASRGLKYVWKQ